MLHVSNRIGLSMFRVQHLEWRKQYDMDNVLNDNLTFFENDYPFFMDGYDYLGGPGVYVWITFFPYKWTRMFICLEFVNHAACVILQLHR